MKCGGGVGAGGDANRAGVAPPDSQYGSLAPLLTHPHTKDRTLHTVSYLCASGRAAELVLPILLPLYNAQCEIVN